MYLSEDRIDKGLFSPGPGSHCGLIHNDHLGTPQKMTDSAGTVVWSADYKPFGEATVTVSTITNNLRFPGQYFDAETGLNQNGFRDYNSAIGRYLTWDPVLMPTGDTKIPYMLKYSLKEPQKLNPYSYVQNNPVRLKDIFGLQANSCELNNCIANVNSNYNTCMNSVSNVNTGITVICVGSAGIQAAFGALPLALTTAVGCFVVTNLEPFVGEIYCHLIKNSGLQACHALYGN